MIQCCIIIHLRRGAVKCVFPKWWIVAMHRSTFLNTNVTSTSWQTPWFKIQSPTESALVHYSNFSFFKTTRFGSTMPYILKCSRWQRSSIVTEHCLHRNLEMMSWDSTVWLAWTYTDITTALRWPKRSIHDFYINVRYQYITHVS